VACLKALNRCDGYFGTAGVGSIREWKIQPQIDATGSGTGEESEPTSTDLRSFAAENNS